MAYPPEIESAQSNYQRAPLLDAQPSVFSRQSSILIRRLGCVDYIPAWHAMREFTAQRTDGMPDEVWLVQHPPVYTLGIAARSQHLPRADRGIAVVRTDRGGQITYHGPGQVIAYLLLDMRRYGLTVRPLVRLMENAVVDLLAGYGVAAGGRDDAPGVYAGKAKIAALGLRIRGGCCYHGVALNVDMDLSPFHLIDPCGYPGLEVTQMRELGATDDLQTVGDKLARCLLARLQMI